MTSKGSDTQENLSSGFLTKPDSNQSPPLQKLARKLEFRLMILSETRITKALITQRGCATCAL